MLGDRRAGAGRPHGHRAQLAAFIKAVLGCQAATVTGHARIGGVQTTVISGSADVALAKGYARTIKETRVRAQWTMYVDSTTYLPVPVDGSTKGLRRPGHSHLRHVGDQRAMAPADQSQHRPGTGHHPPGFQLWKGPWVNQ